MNRSAPLLKLILTSSLFICLLTLLDYLPLHDIFKDYISPYALAYLSIDLSTQLPAWTVTSTEWNTLLVSFILKIILSVLNIILVLVLLKRRCYIK